MVYVTLIEKHAYIENDLIIKELKKQWRHLFTDDEIGFILSAMQDGAARIEKELIVPQEGEPYILYKVEISSFFCADNDFPPIKFEFKETAYEKALL